VTTPWRHTPHEFRLSSIQLQTIGAHPPCDTINTSSEITAQIKMFIRFRRTLQYTHSRTVCFEDTFTSCGKISKILSSLPSFTNEKSELRAIA